MARLLSCAGAAEAREDGLPGIHPEAVFRRDVVVERLELGAVQVLHPAAALAAEEEADFPRRLPGAVLIQGPGIGDDPVDQARLRQALQLAVDRGEAHGDPLVPEVVRQGPGVRGALSPALQRLEDGLALFRRIGHRPASDLKMRIDFIL